MEIKARKNFGGHLDYPNYLFITALDTYGYKFTYGEEKMSSWENDDFQKYFQDRCSWFFRSSGDYLYFYGRDKDQDVAFYGYWTSGELDIQCGAKDFETARIWIEKVVKDIPSPPPSTSKKTAFNFWSCTPDMHGGTYYTRMLDVNTWEECKLNYPEGVNAQVAHTLAMKGEDITRGKLLLWHGKPGTGKTSAIRSLSTEWREWCSFHYIMDPERFFAVPSYMMDVMVRNMGGKPWRLLILEDSDKFIKADAGEVAGQGLQRLLNIGDGLIGQALKVLILITTNENIKSFHPAVTRHGRCLDNIEFTEFPSTEANAWLKFHGLDPNRNSNTSLAELYDLKYQTPVNRPAEVAAPGQYL